ncbi:hypothetical protein BV25DRAFT_1843764, partial [Artomyces pyxidatus]
MDITVEKATVWVLHLDRVEQEEEKYGLESHSVPTFTGHRCGEYVLRWSCNETEGPAMEARCHGLPDGDVVLRFLETTIMNTGYSRQCRVPGLMVLCTDLTNYLLVLAPVLNSLPRPFLWMVEPPVIARLLVAGDQRAVFDYHMNCATKENDVGNRASLRRDHETARLAYTTAIRHTGYAIKMKLDNYQKDFVISLLPVFLANRA